LQHAAVIDLCQPPLSSTRQHLVIVWRLRGNIIRTAPCWVVWHNVHSQQHRAVLTGPADWVSEIGTLMLCIEAVA